MRCEVCINYDMGCVYDEEPSTCTHYEHVYDEEPSTCTHYEHVDDFIKRAEKFFG